MTSNPTGSIDDQLITILRLQKKIKGKEPTRKKLKRNRRVCSGYSRKMITIISTNAVQKYPAKIFSTSLYSKKLTAL
jgi:hypothetical protein